jgi:hypothetical protein
MYCQCQISHKRRKKECLGKFKFSLNRLKKPSSALIVITSRANRSKLCVRKKVKISVDVTTSRVMGNCNSITEITEGKIYSNCQNLNV